MTAARIETPCALAVLESDGSVWVSRHALPLHMMRTGTGVYLSSGSLPGSKPMPEHYTSQLTPVVLVRGSDLQKIQVSTPGLSHGCLEQSTRHNGSDMRSIWSGFVVFSIVSLGVLTAACSGVAGPITGTSSSPSPTAKPAELVEPGTTVSWLRVSPEQGAAGSAVSLDVACLDNLGAAHSPALDIGPLQGNPDGHQPWRVSGTATVRSDTAPGRYRISATCGAGELSTGFTVVPPPPR